MLLEIETTQEPRGVKLTGELDASNVDDLSSSIRRMIEEGGDLTMDLGDLRFMDSSGIQVLVRAARDLSERGNLILLNPGDVVRRLLELIPVTRLDNVEVRNEPRTT